MEVGTYESMMTPSGVLHGKGQGLVRSNDGDALMWTGTGVGKPTGKGLAASWRYTWIMQTRSSRWSRVNGVVGVGEWAVDENGNGRRSFGNGSRRFLSRSSRGDTERASWRVAQLLLLTSRPMLTYPEQRRGC